MVSMNSRFQGLLTLLFRSYQISAPPEDSYFFRKVRRSMHRNSCTILGIERANGLNKIMRTEAQQPVY
jgi:hypothetical protein